MGDCSLKQDGPSDRGCYRPETLVAFDDENMHLRFRLDEPKQYGLSFFEGEYQVVSLGDATSQLANSARFICAERSVEDMKTVWPSNQTVLFDHIKFKLG